VIKREADLTSQCSRVEVEPGVNLHVQQFGTGEPVVFVHAGGMTHAAWDHQIGALATQFRTIAYDCRGVGASDVPATGYSIDALAQDLRHLIQRLELDTPMVVAHGIGAHVALRLVSTCPGLVERVVLVSAAPWSVGDRGTQGGISQSLWATMQAGLAVDRAQADLDLIDQQYFHRPPSEGMRLWCWHMASQWPLGVLRQLIDGMATIDHRPFLAGMELPVLVAHGRHDRKNRYEGGVYLADHLPNARLVTFEESAVCPQLEEVRRFNEVLAEFLAARSTRLAAAADH
jgi:non-heme chloroperoxidase